MKTLVKEKGKKEKRLIKSEKSKKMNFLTILLNSSVIHILIFEGNKKGLRQCAEQHDLGEGCHCDCCDC